MWPALVDVRALVCESASVRVCGRLRVGGRYEKRDVLIFFVYTSRRYCDLFEIRRKTFFHSTTKSIRIILPSNSELRLNLNKLLAGYSWKRKCRLRSN